MALLESFPVTDFQLRYQCSQCLHLYNHPVVCCSILTRELTPLPENEHLYA